MLVKYNPPQNRGSINPDAHKIGHVRRQEILDPVNQHFVADAFPVRILNRRITAAAIGFQKPIPLSAPAGRCRQIIIVGCHRLQGHLMHDHLVTERLKITSAIFRIHQNTADAPPQNHTGRKPGNKFRMFAFNFPIITQRKIRGTVRIGAATVVAILAENISTQIMSHI